MSIDPFATERRTWEAQKPRLLAEARGQYAVFLRERLVCVEHSYLKAYERAIRETRSPALFVQPIEPQETVTVLPACVR